MAGGVLSFGDVRIIEVPTVELIIGERFCVKFTRHYVVGIFSGF